VASLINDTGKIDKANKGSQYLLMKLARKLLSTASDIALSIGFKVNLYFL